MTDLKPLEPYLHHHKWCVNYTHSMRMSCTCGLKEALEEVKRESDKSMAPLNG